MDLDGNKEQAKAVKACYESKKLDLTGVPDEAIGYIVMSNQFSNTILAVTGYDPCKSTNMFDVQIAEVKAKNDVAGRTVSGVVDLASIGLGIWGTVQVVESISDGAGIKVNGDGNATTFGKDQADVVGGSPYVDKSGSGNSKSNVDSTFTSEEDSRNTTTTSATASGDANQL